MSQQRSTVEILKAARARIAQPETWCKEWFARDERGQNRDYNDPEAVKWCAVGSIRKEDTPYNGPVYGALLAQLPEGYKSVSDYNDDFGVTHADILALYDRAIATEEKKA